MHVGVYAECLARPFTGVEIQTKALVDGLKRTKHGVTCFHSADKNHPKIKGVKHHLFRAPLPVPFYHRWAAFFHSTSFDGVDVLHLPSPQFPYVKKPKVPVVVTVHDIIPVFMHEAHNWRRPVFFKHILPGYLKKADAIIAVSEATKRDVLMHYDLPEEKVHVVYNALPPGEYKPLRKKKNYLLFMGTLEPRKNVERIIEAFKMVKERGFPHKLVIAGGKGWKYRGIFDKVKQLGLENDVEFRGYVSGKEKRELFRSASLLVWPSLYEGFGVPVLEAMAYGVPVVTSTASSLPEVAGDAAVLVNPYKSADIANGIIGVLSSKKVKNTLIRKGVKRAKQFSLNSMVKKTLAVYEGVLE